MTQGWTDRARRWWTSTPRLIRRSSLGFILLGLALVCLGLWLDHVRGRTGHEFLTNLFSSLTSLCFGVPAAVLVFSHLGNTQEDARQTERARNHATEKVREFVQILLEPFEATNIGTLAAQATLLQTDLRTLRLQRRSDPLTAQIRDRVRETWRDLLSDADEHMLQYMGLDGAPRDTRQWAQMRQWRARIQSQWKIINDEVRPRATDHGLPWLATNSSADFAQAVNWLCIEGRNPWKLGRGSSANVAAMQYFSEDLLALCAAAASLAALYP